MNSQPEVWLRGPLPGMPDMVQPVAHALMQVQEEVKELMADFPGELLWERPAGMASPGFHLMHMRGVLERLFTYAEGRQLNFRQLAALDDEGKPPVPIDQVGFLVRELSNQINDVVVDLYQIDASILMKKREVGRAKLSSTVIGLYIHAAEHTMRHLGQLLVTVKVLKDVNGLQ
jgi:hypothetical protein